LISIIIPVYNRASIIGETIISIQKQTYKNWECIIVDDGSDDTTIEIVTAFAKADTRIKLFKRPENLIKGANACRNYGFKKSKGAYINWFDSDDIMFETHIEEKVLAIEKDESIELCACENQNFYENNGTYTYDKINTIKEENLLKEFILRKQFIQTGCGLWKRTFLETHFTEQLLFDEQLSQSQDYDFYARALYYKPKLKIINKVLFGFRRGNASISTEFKKVNNSHHSSFIRVRIKLIKIYKDNETIQSGLLNVLLASYNMAINTKDHIQQKSYKQALILSRKEVNKKNKIKLNTILVLAELLKIVGKGSFALRRLFRV